MPTFAHIRLVIIVEVSLMGYTYTKKKLMLETCFKIVKNDFILIKYIKKRYSLPTNRQTNY